MFTNVVDNRKMNVAGDMGGGGDNIIISGDGINNPPKPGAGTPPANTPEEAARLAAEKAAQEAAKVLTGFDDKTDVNLKEVVSAKYSDLSLVKLNSTGDLVNLDGTVLIKKEDLDKEIGTIKAGKASKAEEYFKTLKTVEVNGKQLTISEDGSVKDETGKVILTKEQIIDNILSSNAYLEQDLGDSIFSQADSITGIKLVDEHGNPIEFEETAQGLAQRDLYIARQEGTRIAREYINNFFSEYPDLESAFYYYKTKGSLQGFGQQTNHEGITIKNEDVQQQFDIVVESEMARGYTKEQAIKRANLYKSNDLLLETAKEGLTFMVNQEKAEKDNLRLKYEADQAKIAKEQKEYWENVATKLNSGKILDYTIPETIRIVNPNGTIAYKTKSDFFAYISVPVKNNLTQAQLDASNENLDIKLFNDYLRFTGHNMSYIVGQKVKQNQVSDLKQRFNRDAIPSIKITTTNAASKSNNDNIVI